MNHVLLITLSAVIAFTAAAQPGTRIEGNGDVVTVDRNVTAFEHVASGGSFEVYLSAGPTHKVSVEAESNIEPVIITEVRGDKLIIRSKGSTSIQTTRPIKIHVQCPVVRTVVLSGSGNLRSTNQLSADGEFALIVSGSGSARVDVVAEEVKTAVSGSGSATLSGKTTEFEGRISGSGGIHAMELESEESDIKISGSGQAEIVASKRLNSRISGSGNVIYRGNATVDSRTSGSGRVKKEG